MLKIRETFDNIIIVLAESKLFDGGQILTIGQEFQDLIGKTLTAKKRLVIDFEGIKFLSSSNIGMLVFLEKQCREHVVDLKFSGCPDEVVRMFELMNLKPHLDDDPDLLGSWVPKPNSPDSLGGHAEPPRE